MYISYTWWTLISDGIYWCLDSYWLHAETDLLSRNFNNCFLWPSPIVSILLYQHICQWIRTVDCRRKRYYCTHCYHLLIVHLIQDPLNEAQWEQTQKLHHLHISYTSASLFFGSSGFMYLKSSLAVSMDEWKIYPIFYTIVVPMVIPLIYSLRRKDATVALRKILRRTILSSEI